MSDLGEGIVQVHNELPTEFDHWLIHHLCELVSQTKMRGEMERQLASIEKKIHLLHQQLEYLPAHPDLSDRRRAQILLNNPDSRIVVVGTVFPSEALSVAQVFVLDLAGTVRLSQCVAAGYQLTGEERRMLGLTVQDLQGAVSLAEVWPTLLAELQGCYIVAYNLEQIRRVLVKAASEHDLEQPVVIGECLLQICLRYYRASGLTGLASLCEHIGYPLPAYPTAADCARGQLRLLQAMAAGVCP